MSVRNGFVLLLALSALTFLVACGGSSSGIANPVAPPTGGFTNANLNGTYVFSIAGADQASGLPYAIAGTLTADGSGGNGKGNITAGTIDINDSNTSEFTAPVAGVSINSGGFYNVNVDGRGQITIGLSQAISNFPNLTFDFVLQDNNHGLITEFDDFATGSGTLDLQAAGVTPTGSYAFSLSGAAYSGSPWATVGNFTLTGTTISGLDDLDEGVSLSYPGQTLSGSLALASSAGPATTLTTVDQASATTFSGLFDAFAIDATHLKLIEMDTTATLSGDAFSQTSTAFPTGSLAFTLQGDDASSAPFAAGGIMTTTGTSISGTEDYNQDGSVSSASTPPPFTAAYAAGGTGRFTLGSFATFVGGTSYAAYPYTVSSSVSGLFLLEIDEGGITTGAAYAQNASATLAASQGYGLNLSGINLTESASAGGLVEVDDIAEFTTSSSGNTITGVIDENSDLNGAPVATSAPFVNNSSSQSTYTTPTGGRGQIGASVGTSSNNSTLNGGFLLTYYTVDGTTFPFIETDSGQVSSGVFVQQSSSGSASAARPAMFVVQPLFRPHANAKKQKQTKFN
jgi:hypothetical protein